MLTLHARLWHVVAAATVLTAAQAALAQEDPIPDPKPPTREEIAGMLEKALPSIIGSDNAGLVAKLLAPRLGKPLSQGFSAATATRRVFGTAQPTLTPDCAVLLTPTGDPDPGECTAYRGAEAGGKGYTRLSYSKHMGLGTVKLLKRPTDVSVTPAGLKPVQLPDADAYARATNFLTSAFGLPGEEIPVPPEDAKNPYPVRSLSLGYGDVGRSKGSTAIRKVVTIQRGLFVDLRDRTGKSVLPWVQAPGRAIVVLDDGGIRQATVLRWSELRPNPRTDAKLAKTRSALVEEMAEDLLHVNRAPIASLKAMIVITEARVSSASQGTFGYLLPAVRLSVSPVPSALLEDDQAKQYSTAGYLREYPLVGTLEDAADDEAGPAS
jgi:hypothetical protein